MDKKVQKKSRKSQGSASAPVVETSAVVMKNGDVDVITTSIASIESAGRSVGMGPTESKESRRLLAADGAIPADVVELASEVGARYGSLVGGNHFDVTKFEEYRGYLKAIQPLRNTIAGLLRQVDDEMLRRRAVLGTECRALYKYLQALAVTPVGSPIRDPLDRMAKAMRHRAPAKTVAAPDATTPVTPAPVDAAK